MAFHIPFEHRQRNRQHIGPIYIGFDEPQRRPRRKFNWWGFNGLWLSLASFMTAGFLSPIPLIISLVGLRKGPRKMAIAGTFFSLLGTGLAAALIIGAISHDQHQSYVARMHRQQRELAVQLEEVKVLMADAKSELEEYRDSHDGAFPSWIDCNMLMLKYEDPWGMSLRFDADGEDFGTLRSAGADQEYDSRDDLTQRIEGETDQRVLLELD